MERRKLFFEDVQEGGAVPPFVVERLARMDLVRYAGASGDFNPIHTDEEFARAAGNPSVFGHGMLTAAFEVLYVGSLATTRSCTELTKTIPPPLRSSTRC